MVNVNLEDFPFTKGSDLFDLDFSEGLPVVNNSLVTTLHGDDTIEATLHDEGDALTNRGTIDNGLGNDSLIAISDRGRAIVNEENALIETDRGDDLIKGWVYNVGDAILNRGTIAMGIGNDTIIGGDRDSTYSIGIVNEESGVIDTGSNDDSIIAFSGWYKGGTSIINRGEIVTGSGHDTITVEKGYEDWDYYAAITNTGSISMGHGNDSLTGANVYGGGLTAADIDNSGTISMGKGYDFIDGTFVGGGNIDLGGDDDIIEIDIFPFTRAYEADSQHIDGGNGFDTAKFAFDLDDRVEVGVSDRLIEVSYCEYPGDLESIWTLRNVESLEFNGEVYSLAELASEFGDFV